MSTPSASASKPYFLTLDLLRVLACVAVLLYHFGLLPGGYLAVCVFFVLSGYLSCASAWRKEPFSLLYYYRNRLRRVYLPVLIMVFLTVAVMAILGINFLNLKPEVTSILGGYNNYWQLGANLDYFARHLDSPFMHLWYIAILLQFELFFPIIFLGLKNLGQKHHSAPILILAALTCASAGYFVYLSLNGQTMSAYYGTFARVFSLLIGVLLGFVQQYRATLVPKVLRTPIGQRLLILAYLALLTAFCIVADASGPLFIPGMLIATFAAVRLIDYGTLQLTPSRPIAALQFCAGISYEIYLFQYPLIFFLGPVDLPSSLKIILITALLVPLSALIHFATSPNTRFKVCRWLLRLAIAAICLFGLYEYIIAPDHTAEMHQLEAQLAENTLLMEQKQAEYQARLDEQSAALNQTLATLAADEANLDAVIHALPIVGIGDSVMLGAVPNLYEAFPNGYFDGQVSRSSWVVNGILQSLAAAGQLGDPILINVGANGDCSVAEKERILATLGDREVFWVTVTNDASVHVNAGLAEFASTHSHFHIIDWASLSAGHDDYFYADGLHLTPAGRSAYVAAVTSSLLETYQTIYAAKKSEVINAHAALIKNQLTFLGNNTLLGASDLLATTFPDAKFTAAKGLSFAETTAALAEAAEQGTLTDRLVLIFDTNTPLTRSQYLQLAELYPDQTFYLVTLDERSSQIAAELDTANFTIIDFYNTALTEHPEYRLLDQTYLSAAGNQALLETLTAAL